jgi:hypothetical protein
MGAQRCNTGAGDLGQPVISRICDDNEQLIDTSASDGCDDAKLGEMRTDRIDHGGLLANEQMPGAMKHQATLLLRRLGFYEPHGRPANGFADRLCVGSIVFLPLHVGLHVGRRHHASPCGRAP